MLRAAQDGDVPAIRVLVAGDANLVRAEYAYVQPLHIAVLDGHLESTRTLLEAGAEPGQAVDGVALSTHARERGRDDIAALLERAAARRRELTPGLRADHAIHNAAHAGDASAVRSLLGQDPSLVNLVDRAGGTPLHRAVAASAKQVATLLLDSGADIHALHGAGPASLSGYAPAYFEPIDLALWLGPFWNTRGDFDTAQLLINRGARYDLIIAAAFGDATRAQQLLETDPHSIAAMRPSGKHALPAAVEFGRDLASLLLERGADPNWPDGSAAPRGSALHAAARRGDAATARLLLGHGADPNATIDASGSATFAAKTRDLRRMLLHAGGRLDPYDLAWLGEEAELLRRVREDPHSANRGCGGVLAAACKLGKHDLLERLLALGVRVPPVVSECRSYLWSDPEMLQLLLRSGMDPNVPDFRLATPLHDLCGKDGRGRPRPHRSECAWIMLRAGADINALEEAYRSTPLGWAARTGLLDMVELLLARGADKLLPTDAQWATPIGWAKARGHADIVRRLSG